MSLAFSAPLQAAVFARLSGDPAVTALVGNAIHDALPPGIPPTLYVLLGPEEVRPRHDSGGRGAEHDFTISVISETAGFHTAKALAHAICEALASPDLSLSGGVVVGLWFRHARARRLEQGNLREIVLTFRARIDAPL